MGAKHLPKALVHIICDGSEKTSNFEYFLKMSYCYQHIE